MQTLPKTFQGDVSDDDGIGFLTYGKLASGKYYAGYHITKYVFDENGDLVDILPCILSLGANSLECEGDTLEEAESGLLALLNTL